MVPVSNVNAIIGYFDLTRYSTYDIILFVVILERRKRKRGNEIEMREECEKGIEGERM